MPSVHVDKGFWYSVPDGFFVEVGSVVRVPLGGRTVRGWVVATDSGDRDRLKPIRRISGDHTVFSKTLLQTLQWAALHYVAPLASLLKKTSPPNLPRRATSKKPGPVPECLGRHSELGSRIATGSKAPTTVIVNDVSATDLMSCFSPVLAAERSVLLICPTGVEAQRMFDSFGEYGNRRILVHPDMSDRQVTDRWSRLREDAGLIVVGTERISLWPIAELALAWVHGDGRRGLKARQTPTIGVREVMRSRAAAERFSLVVSSSVPSTEALVAGSTLVRGPGRAWPRAEVVDRGEDPPGGGGVLGIRVRSALASATKQGKHSFVFTHRHGYAPAFRCVSCRLLRVCDVCEARATGTTLCARCGNELGPCAQCARRTFEPMGAGEGRVLNEVAKFVGGDAVGSVGSGRNIQVGTERDIPLLGDQHLAVAVDADGLIFGTNYRAPETALRLLARVAGTVANASGARMMIQTSRPSHPVIKALQRGEPLAVLHEMLTLRQAQGLPPYGELLVLDVRSAPDWLPGRLHDLDGALMGPMPGSDRQRWLLQGADLGPDKRLLRTIVQDLRDASASVRVDADPLDL